MQSENSWRHAVQRKSGMRRDAGTTKAAPNDSGSMLTLYRTKNRFFQFFRFIKPPSPCDREHSRARRRRLSHLGAGANAREHQIARKNTQGDQAAPLTTHLLDHPPVANHITPSCGADCAVDCFLVGFALFLVLIILINIGRCSCCWGWSRRRRRTAGGLGLSGRWRR
jgi:hypothetical protein